MKDGNCLAVCESMHDVIGLERALKDNGLWCGMIPTPRAVSSDCGMSIEFSCEDQTAMAKLVGERQICVAGVYSFSAGSFTEVRSEEES